MANNSLQMENQANFQPGETGNPGGPRKERKRCVAWTEEEHRNFLIGMEVLGVGNWKGVSQVYVPTRTAPQIASHAQKYFHRVGDKGKKRARPSLFDLDLKELDDIVVAKKAALDARAKDGAAADLKALPRDRTYKDRGREAYPPPAAAAAYPGAAAAAAAAAGQANPRLRAEAGGSGAGQPGAYDSEFDAQRVKLQTQAKIQSLQAQLDRLQQQADRLTKDAAPSAAAAAAPGPSPDLLGLIAHASQVQLQVEEHRREIEKAFGAGEPPAGAADGAQALAATAQAQGPAAGLVLPFSLPTFPMGRSHENGRAAGGAAASPSAASPPAAPSPRRADQQERGNNGNLNNGNKLMGLLGSSAPGAAGAALRGATLTDRLAAALGHGQAHAAAGAAPLPAVVALLPSQQQQQQQGTQAPQSLSQLHSMMMAAAAAGDAQNGSTHAATDGRLGTMADARGPAGPGPASILVNAFPQAQSQPQSYNAAPNTMSMSLLGFNGMSGFDLGSGGLTFNPGNSNGSVSVGGLNLINLGSAQGGFAQAGPSQGNQQGYFAAPMGFHPQFPQGGIFITMPQAAPGNGKGQPQGQPQGMAFSQGEPTGHQGLPTFVQRR